MSSPRSLSRSFQGSLAQPDTCCRSSSSSLHHAHLHRQNQVSLDTHGAHASLRVEGKSGGGNFTVDGVWLRRLVLCKDVPGPCLLGTLAQAQTKVLVLGRQLLQRLDLPGRSKSAAARSSRSGFGNVASGLQMHELGGGCSPSRSAATQRAACPWSGLTVSELPGAIQERLILDGPSCTDCATRHVFKRGIARRIPRRVLQKV